MIFFKQLICQRRNIMEITKYLDINNKRHCMLEHVDIDSKGSDGRGKYLLQHKWGSVNCNTISISAPYKLDQYGQKFESLTVTIIVKDVKQQAQCCCKMGWLLWRVDFSMQGLSNPDAFPLQVISILYYGLVTALRWMQNLEGLLKSKRKRSGRKRRRRKEELPKEKKGKTKKKEEEEKGKKM